MTMIPSSNPFGGSTVTDKRFGNVYPIIKSVYEKLGEIAYLADNLNELRPRNVELRQSGGMFQWRHTDAEAWQDLFALADIEGEQGDPGPTGIDGREVELRMDGNWLQWRYIGDATWTNLWQSTEILPDGSVTDVKVATGTKLYSRVNDMVSVTDFGAKGDNTTEDLPAFTAAAAAVNGPVFVPPNRNYKLAGGGNNFKHGLGYYDVQSAADDPATTIQVTRKISSLGSTASQTGGFIVYNDVEAGVTHHEYGMFSVLNNYATATANEPVAFYAQANSLGAGASPLWAGVLEVGNIRPDGTKSTASSVLAALEVDVNNWFAFDAALKKLGVVCIARGGGECNEAFTARGEGVAPGGGFFSGYWRVGFWIQGGGLNPTQGTGLLIDSDHSNGVTITGKSANFGVNIAGGVGSSAGLRIGPNYSTAIIVPPDRKILMNDAGNPQGISYVSGSSALMFDAASLGLVNHTTYSSASAGGAGAPPGAVGGYIGVVINGTPCKIPYYPA